MRVGTRKFVITALAAALLGVVGSSSRADASGTPGVLHAFAGRSTAQWSARWWQWAAGLPAAQNPLVGADCRSGQDGPVFFLVGTTGDTDVKRTCHVPRGKALLVPAINSECSSVTGDCGSPASDYRTLRRAAGALFASGVTATIEVDGDRVPVQHVVTPAPPFAITFADLIPFQVPPGSGVSVADGYYTLLAPLRVGRHTVTLFGSVPTSPPFTVGATYTLIVDG
jgi:hypothetical protein